MSDDPFKSFVNVLLVEITMPESPELGFPAANFIATCLMAELVKSNLRQAGLDDTGGGVGEFNQSMYIFWLIEPVDVVRVVGETLRTAKLENSARLYRYDAVEQIFRCLFPKNGNAVLCGDILGKVAARFDAGVKFQMAGLELIHRVFGVNKSKPSGLIPPPQDSQPRSPS